MNKMTLKIYLIRHGETDFNKQGKEWGQPAETSLNEIGIKQSEKLAQKIKDIKFNKLFSSDLKRSLQTTGIVSKAVGIPIIKDKRLREYDPGEADPSSEKWIEEYKRLLNLGMSKYDIRPFGGENIWDLIKRVKSFLDDLEKDKGTIAIISHSGVNSTLINLSQGREKDHFLNIKQDSTCINVLNFENMKWHIEIINDSHHIDEIKPQKKNYENQEEIKEIARSYVLEKLDSVAKEIYLSGDILSEQFGFYDRPYKRYKGSTVEIYLAPKGGFEIPQKWKISLSTKNIKKYEIGEIKINDKKHKVNVMIIGNSSEIKHKTERLK
jgi:broad specificity phosphatase PhoE